MSNFKIGLQLYGVRGDLERDFEGTLKAVAEMGYEYVEFAGYYGRSAEEIKALLEKYSLKCVSVHQMPEFFAEKGKEGVEFLKTFGVKYSVIPSYPRHKLKGTPDYDQTVKFFTEVGQLLKDNGMELLYHNHDYEYEKFEDKYLIDWLLSDVPNLDPQFDVCWVNYGGEDPVKYLEKYAGRVDVIHLKDFVCTKLKSGPVYALIDKDGKTGKVASHNDTGFEYKPLGKGVQDIPAILAAAERAGTKYIIVEQDDSSDLPPLEAMRISREYLKSLGI